MSAFCPIAHVPDSIGAIVPLETGQLGALYDQRQAVAAIYMGDSISLSRTHSTVTVAQARAAIQLLTELIVLMTPRA